MSHIGNDAVIDAQRDELETERTSLSDMRGEMIKRSGYSAKPSGMTTHLYKQIIEIRFLTRDITAKGKRVTAKLATDGLKIKPQTKREKSEFMCNECGMVYSFVFGTQFHKADCPEVQSEQKEEVCSVCGDTEEWCPNWGN